MVSDASCEGELVPECLHGETQGAGSMAMTGKAPVFSNDIIVGTSAVIVQGFFELTRGFYHPKVQLSSAQECAMGPSPRGPVAVDQMSVRNKKQMNKPGADLQRGRDMMQRFHEGLCSREGGRGRHSGGEGEY